MNLEVPQDRRLRVREDPMTRRNLVCFILLLAFIAARALEDQVRAQDDGQKAAPKQGQAKPKEDPGAKKKQARLSDCIGRGIERAAHEIDKRPVMITVIPVTLTNSTDENTHVVFFEFQEGGLGIFQGFQNPEYDQLVLLTPADMNLLEDIQRRAFIRSRAEKEKEPK